MYEVKLINKEVETIIHYATSDKNAPHLLAMNIQLFENQSNIFSFVIYKNYQGYDKIIDLFTKVKVTDTTKSKIKFEGRVLISNEIMDDSGKFYKEVTCESELAYLNDSRVGRWELYPAGLIEGAASYAETYQTINSALQKIITNHNTNVEVDKQFSLGVVEISGGVYFSTNYESSLDILISKIVSDNGVVVKIRKENGIRYLDILADDPPISSTPIYLRKNLKSFKKTPDYSTFCTRLIAIGADGLTFNSINGGKNYVENTDAINNFGTITKTFEWPDITTPEELLAKAQLRLYNILNNSYVAVEVTALDLSYIGLTPDEFDISTSYLIDNEVQNFSEVLKVVQLDLDLLAPWNSRLVFANKPIVSTSSSKDVRQQVSANRTESITQNGRLNEKLEIYKNQVAYVHPATHPPSIIAQDANNRFVKDTDITNWNGKVAQTDINNSINAIQIGGRNLLTNSDFETGTSSFGGYDTSTLTWSADYAYMNNHSLKVVCGSGGSGASRNINELLSHIKGKTLTLSWKVKGIGSSIGKQVYANIYDDVFQSRSGTRVTLTSDWQTISVTATISSTATGINVYWLGNGSLVSGDIVYADCAKLEIGTKVTDWTPAPEDVQGQIDSVTTRVTTTESSISVLQGQIVSKVSQTDVDTSINALQIGGKNLIPDSKIATTSSEYGFGSRTLLMDFVAGQTYTLTVNGRIDSQALADGKALACYIYENTWTHGAYSLLINSITDTTKSITFIPGWAGRYTVCFYLFASGGSRLGTATVNWATLVLGNKALVDWMAAPEDIQDQQDQLDKRKIDKKPSNIRYIRDWLNGSTTNGGNHWVEIQAYDTAGTNVALSKPITGSGEHNNLSLAVDGNTDVALYVGGQFDIWQYVLVDLGSLIDIDAIKVWHYYADARRYNTTLEVSSDGVYWYKIYDSATQGTYVETSSGKCHILNASIVPGSCVIAPRTDATKDVGTCKEMRWNNYGSSHTIFDASRGITPNGTACNNTSPEVSWVPTYPTLMGYNGGNTYGVRVEKANVADNSDMLDGKHSSDFAPSGYGLGSTPRQTVDLNYAYTAGWYYGNNVANSPITGGIKCFVIPYSESSTYCTQIVCGILNSSEQYIRTDFGTWYKIYTSRNKPTASDVGALPNTGGSLSGSLTLDNCDLYLSNSKNIYGQDMMGMYRSLISINDVNKTIISDGQGSVSLSVKDSHSATIYDSSIGQYQEIYHAGNKPTLLALGASMGGVDGTAVAVSNTDLNNLKTTGFFRGEGMTNAPTSNWWYIICIRHTDAWIYQEAIAFSSGTFPYQTRQKYCRVCEESVWSQWDLVYTSNNKPKVVDLPIDYSFSKSFAITANVWVDTGITAGDLATGTYVVVVKNGDAAVTNMWEQRASGIMSWIGTNTNSTDSNEIVLHQTGHASNGRVMRLRTLTNPSGYCKLQMTCNVTLGTSGYAFEFKRIM